MILGTHSFIAIQDERIRVGTDRTNGSQEMENCEIAGSLFSSSFLNIKNIVHFYRTYNVFQKVTCPYANVNSMFSV